MAAALLLAIGLILALAAPARAQEAQAQVIFDPAPLTVGDVFSLRIEVRHPAGTVAILPDLASGWGDLEVRDQQPAQVTENEDGSLTTSQQIEAALFAPGSYQAPALPVAVSDRTGATFAITTEPVALVVNSVLTDADTEPRDLKPQALVGGGWQRPAMLAAGVLAALAAAAALVWWLRRRGGLLGKTPLERALAELDAIAAAGYPRQNKYQELYFEVTHCMRHHLEREFSVPCDDRTTSEMRAMLRPLPLSPDVERRLLTLFQESDLVKFARVTPTPESADALLAEARGLCRELSQARAMAVAPQQPAAGAVAARG